MGGIVRRMERFLGRAQDRPVREPPGLVYGLDATPPLAQSLGLALQHLSVQSVYFVLPAAAAAAVTQDPVEITRFLCLSILASAIYQMLGVLTRGLLGSGYPIPGTHTAATLGAYVLVGQAGGGFGAVSAMVLLVGLVSIGLTFVVRRLRVALPNEVAGVVVILIGVALLALAAQQLGIAGGGALPSPTMLAVTFASLATMIGVTLSRTKAAPFAVLCGAGVGILLAVPLGLVPPHATELLAASPWVALPVPWLPDFSALTPAPALAGLLALVAMTATQVGSLVMAQRATDANWTRPDPVPLRRGLLANGVAVAAAGLIGGAAPGPATAALGLSVATGTLARRIVVFGVPLMVALALCPKAVALFVLMPAAVKAAMLFFVAGFIMAQGCQLTTVRLLDTRRMLIVACGLGAGITVAVAPQAFRAVLPALASPLSFGAVMAFLANLFTLPLVSQRGELKVALGIRAGREASDWFAALAGSWGLKPQTSVAAEHALSELAELLAERGVAGVTLSARRTEDRVEIGLVWTGEPLPERSARVDAEDLLGPVEAQERFALWMATRAAQSYSQRVTADGAEARLIFED